ncbi:MAG: homocysteine S-methyltransferase [Gemmatimonadota bacterium]|jgi:homocysteine S-methyltransferase
MVPPSPFSSFFARQGVVILDGGLATALESLGHDLDDPLWSARVLLDAPESVQRVHQAYLAAGADCIATVTYQATFEGFRRRGLSDGEAEALFLRAVALAVEARDAFWADVSNRRGREKPMVAASIGPYGAFLADGSEYTGRYDLDEDGLVSWHRRRWHLLAGTEVDLMACETLPSLAEGRALLRLLEETPDRWAWLSFQCADERHLADGSLLADAARACEGVEQVAAVGVNCVAPRLVAPLLQAAREGTTRPLVAYPNSGEVYDASSRTWRPGVPGGDLVGKASAWRARGATVLGGCCRTGPGTIAALRRSLLDTL